MRYRSDPLNLLKTTALLSDLTSALYTVISKTLPFIYSFPLLHTQSWAVNLTAKVFWVPFTGAVVLRVTWPTCRLPDIKKMGGKVLCFVHNFDNSSQWYSLVSSWPLWFSQLRQQLHKKDEWATTKEEGWDRIIWRLELPVFTISVRQVALRSA